VTYVIGHATALIPRVLDLASQMRGNLEPAEGSTASRELEAATSAFQRESLKSAYHLGNMRLNAVEDFLSGWAATIAAPAVVYTPLVVIRSAFEVGARAWWLLDPGIPAVERVRRLTVDRLESLYQQLRGLGPRFVTDEMPRALALAQEAEDHGIAVAWGKTEIAGVRFPKPTDKAMPTLTELANAMLASPDNAPPSGRLIYSVLSGFSHGEIYALTHVMEDISPTEGVEGLWGRAEATARHDAQYGSVAVLAYMKAGYAQEQLHQWDPRLVLPWASQVGDLLSALSEIMRVDPPT